MIYYYRTVKVISFVLVLALILSLSGCKNIIQLENDNSKVNYNNIYNCFPQENIWVDENTIYFSESRIGNSYFRTDNNGKTKITSDSTFWIQAKKGASDGEICSYMQAYGDDVYFWYNNAKNECELYRYSKANKTFEKILTVNLIVFEWAIFNNRVIFSAFSDEYLNKYHLYSADLESKELYLISDEVLSFGIADDELRYITINEGDYNSSLYKFNFKAFNHKLITDFDSKGQINTYNYTKDKLIYFKSENLIMLDINTNETQSFKMSGFIDFISCYDNFAFVSTENYVYRVNLSSGEIKELYKHNGTCMLINAINDKSAVFICYKERNIRTEVIFYQINADGKVKKLF